MAFEREYRDLAFVPRWSIMRQIKGQSVAEHSFYVALYAEQIARLIGWQGDIGALLRYALYHDMEECFTGDMPGPVKRIAHDATKYDAVVLFHLIKRFPDAFPVHADDEIRAIVKMADGLDEIFYIASEMQLGNRAVHNMYNVVIKRYREITCKLLIDVFRWKPDDADNFWRITIVKCIDDNGVLCSEVLNDMEIK